MINRFYFTIIVIVSLISCNKENQKGIYIINAGKMIELTGKNWSNAEAQLNRKEGYVYTPTPASSGIKADVRLTALDDSNRVVSGSILLNVATDNHVQFAMFNSDPIAQPAAYAMMLNYHNGSLQLISGITSSIGEVIENGAGGNAPVSTVLSKLTNGQLAEQLAIVYHCAQGRFTMVIFKQNDGRYVFSFRGVR